MTDKEVMQMALNALEIYGARAPAVNDTIEALRACLAQFDPEQRYSDIISDGGLDPRNKPEQEPVAMKFQIYKQTPPRGRELEHINSALLPWVYDQDPSSGNTASMWVTPVATLPPQREWKGLTDDEYELMAEKRVTNYFFNTLDYAHDIEAKLKEKNT